MEPTPTSEPTDPQRAVARAWPVHGVPVPVQRDDESGGQDEPADPRGEPARPVARFAAPSWPDRQVRRLPTAYEGDETDAGDPDGDDGADWRDSLRAPRQYVASWPAAPVRQAYEEPGDGLHVGHGEGGSPRAGATAAPWSVAPATAPAPGTAPTPPPLPGTAPAPGSAPTWAAARDSGDQGSDPPAGRPTTVELPPRSPRAWDVPLGPERGPEQWAGVGTVLPAPGGSGAAPPPGASGAVVAAGPAAAEVAADPAVSAPAAPAAAVSAPPAERWSVPDTGSYGRTDDGSGEPGSSAVVATGRDDTARSGSHSLPSGATPDDDDDAAGFDAARFDAALGGTRTPVGAATPVGTATPTTAEREGTAARTTTEQGVGVAAVPVFEVLPGAPDRGAAAHDEPGRDEPGRDEPPRDGPARDEAPGDDSTAGARAAAPVAPSVIHRAAPVGATATGADEETADGPTAAAEETANGPTAAAEETANGPTAAAEETANGPTAAAEETADSPAPLRPGDVPETRLMVWNDESAQHFRDDWHEVKALFVDEPVEALHRAKSLVTDAINEVTAALVAQQDGLDPLGRAALPDTETMRVAMRRYREFLDRILEL